MKFNLKKNALLCMSMMIVAVSCDKEMEDTIKTSPNNAEAELIAFDPDIVVTPLPDDKNVPENGYTDEELAAQGWKTLSVYSAKSVSIANEGDLKARKIIQEKRPNMQGLKNMGYFNDEIWAAGKNLSRPNTDADGYCINGEHHGKKPGKTNLSKKYNWWLTANMYSPKKKFHKSYKSGWKDVNGTKSQVQNRSNTTKTCPWGHVVYTKSLEESASFTVEATAGLSWGFGVNVEVFKIDVNSSISLKFGKTTTQRTTETVTHKSEAFKMKPKTAYQIKLQYRKAKQKVTHTFPVELSGLVGFNYKKQVQDYSSNTWAYFKGFPADKIFKKKHEARIVCEENFVDEYKWSIKEVAKIIEM